jgi:hypothetical protein
MNKPPIMAETPPPSSRKWWALALVGGASIAAVLYFFPPEQNAFYPQCVFRSVTGMDCPGCGGLRAAHQLLHGNLAAAWKLNPVAVLLSPLFAYELFIRFGRHRTRPSLLQRPLIGLGVVALFVAFGIVRNLPLLAGK